MIVSAYDMSAPWNKGVRGEQVLPLINDDGGAIRCEAGPGTGKTFGLVRRVIRLLSPTGAGLAPDEVLVVAFNRVIARELRERIDEGLRQAGYDSDLPRISTIHSYCLDNLGVQNRVLLPHEVEAMAYDLVTDCPKLRDEYPGHRLVMRAIKLEGSGVGESALLRDRVKHWLERHKAGTISDLPAELLGRIELGDYEQTYRQVVVDEFQDLTSSEQQLVFKLVSTEGTILAVGDQRQSIYRFRGNSPEGLSKISELTDMPLRDIALTVCQRCPNRFVDVANTIQIASPAPRLEYGNWDPDSTHVVFWKSVEAEAKGMARAIVEKLRASNVNDTHLIMTTRRLFGYKLRDALKAINEDLRVKLVFSEEPLGTWAVREAFIAYCLLTDPDGPTWRSWFAYRKPNATATYRANQCNSAAYLDLLTKAKDNITFQVVEAVASGKLRVCGSGQSHIRERAQRFLEVRERWAEVLAKPDKLVECFFQPDAWPGSPADDQRSVEHDFATIRTLTHDLFEDSRGRTFGERLVNTTRSLRAHIATRDTEVVRDEQVDLTIATMWSAKGVTADHVYVLGLCEEAIPGECRDDYPGTEAEYLQEQRRLFYVSVTRSKSTLVLSYAKSIATGEGKRNALNSPALFANGKRMRLRVSPFLLDIRECLPAAMPGENWAGCV